MLRSLLTLSDVMATGHHAAVCAQVPAGQTVAVVGDGAVGLSGVLAAKRLRTARIIALSRNPARQEFFDPGRVLDYETDVDGIGEAWAAMDERRAIKSLVRVGTV
jgi:threonine dehydrogenase-like Zn-dependent dehydrogenase